MNISFNTYSMVLVTLMTICNTGRMTIGMTSVPSIVKEPHIPLMCGRQVVWEASCVGCKLCGMQAVWEASCVGGKLCGRPAMWEASCEGFQLCGMQAVWEASCVGGQLCGRRCLPAFVAANSDCASFSYFPTLLDPLHFRYVDVMSTSDLGVRARISFIFRRVQVVYMKLCNVEL